MVNYVCAFSQSELGKYFEWIIIFSYWSLLSTRVLFPFFVICHYYQYSEALWGYPLDMKKVFLFGAGRLQEQSVLSIGAYPTRNKHWKCQKPLSFWLCCCSDNVVIQSRQISTHPPPSKVGFLVLFCFFVHWPSENKEADLARRWVRRDLS